MTPRIVVERCYEDDDSPSRELPPLSCNSYDTGDSSLASFRRNASCSDFSSPLQSTLVLQIRPSPNLRARRKLTPPASQAEDCPSTPTRKSSLVTSPTPRSSLFLSTPIEAFRSNKMLTFHSEPFKRRMSSSQEVQDNRAESKDFYNGNVHHVEAVEPIEELRRGGDNSLRDSLNTPERLFLGRRFISGKQANMRLQRNQKRWLIPAEHPYKILWDILTFTLSIANAYATHTAVRDRKFGDSPFATFCEIWFVVDILLNFVTEYKTGQGLILRDCQSVWARYLTSWFVVDVLSLFPAESLYVQPIIDEQNRRGIFKKSFFRTRAVIRVTRVLRGRHFKLFGRVVSHTKHAGVGGSRLLRLIIKYVPKYLLFFRNMKGILALRLLRQYHWFGKVWRNIFWNDVPQSCPLEENSNLLRKDTFVYEPDWEFVDDGDPY